MRMFSLDGGGIGIAGTKSISNININNFNNIGGGINSNMNSLKMKGPLLSLNAVSYTHLMDSVIKIWDI